MEDEQSFKNEPADGVDGDGDYNRDSDSTEDDSLKMTSAKAKPPKTAPKDGGPIVSSDKARRGSLAYYEASSAAVKQSRSTRWKKHGKPSSSRRKKKQLLEDNKKKGRRSLKRQDTISRPGSNDFGGLWAFAFKKDYLQFEQLIEEDQDREQVASFCEEPFWKIIFHWKGTVLTVIVEDVLFWMTLAIYAAVRMKIRLGDPEAGTVDQEEYANLSSNLVYVGGFLLFFLVFYVNQNHHRYFQLHQDSMCLMGRINDVATMAKACLPMERARRIVRFMNAAHVTVYTGLSNTYEKHNFFDPLEARFALLTEEETERIVDELDVDNSGPKPAFELLTWAMMDIRDAKNEGHIDTNEALQMRTLVLEFRSTVAKIFVTSTVPIPFFYVHFLSLLTAAYLPLFAVIVAFQTGSVDVMWSSELVSAMVIILQALFVIGLRILGQQLSDPYGDDLIDLQITRYVNMILNGSNQILLTKRLEPPSIETELKLKNKMSSLGEAHEYGVDEERVEQF